ncbi:MAG: hypothetical protein HXL26_00640 [Porphyromonadaceae bacterium]|nr:hypothetical protein [Porphyromonadaceae bacterium]
MKGKDIATGRAQAEELDPLHAARTTSTGRDRGSQSNPLSLEEFRQLRMQGDFAPYWVKIGEQVYFAPYGKGITHARQVCPFIDRYKIKSYF